MNDKMAEVDNRMSKKFEGDEIRLAQPDDTD